MELNGNELRVGAASSGPARRFSNVDDIRRFRITHALRSIEHALLLLDSRPAEGIEISALERVRDDLAVLTRTTVR